MTITVERLKGRFTGPFSPQQATVLAETIYESYTDLVKTSDFNELKQIMRELAQAQAQTDVSLKELAQAQAQTDVSLKELAQAQAQTDVSLKELAQAQTRTEVELRRLTQQVSGLAQEMGGLSRSASYSLENEAYRLLPAYLESNYGIVLDERMVRTDISGEEVNIFALGQRDGKPIALVGETKLQFDRRRGSRDALEIALEQLERKVTAVQSEYPDRGIVRLLVTHYARPAIRRAAEERNVIIVQSFEW